MSASHRTPLGDSLRQWRKAADLKQIPAAKALGFSQGKLQKIEAGTTKTVSEEDLGKMVALYEIPETEAARLFAQASRPWPDASRYSARVTEMPKWFQRLAKYQPLARSIKTVSLERPNGLLQCESYIRLQFSLAGTPNADVKLRQRLARAAAVLDQDEPPKCVFILSESALCRNLGDRAVQLQQLRHLLELGRRSNITILVVEFEARISSMGYEYEIYEFDGTVEESDFVYTEQDVWAEYLRKEQDIKAYLSRWARTEQAALNEVESRTFISDLADDVERKLLEASR